MEGIVKMKLQFFLLFFILLTGCSPLSRQERVEKAARTEMSRTLTQIALTPVVQNDAHSGSDAGCDVNDPLFVHYQEFTGQLAAGDELDCYAINYQSGLIVDIRVTANSPVLNIQLDRNTDFDIFQKISDTEYQIRYAVGRSKNVDESVRIIIKSIFPALYTVNVNYTPQNDAGSGTDAGFGLDALYIQPGTYTGFIGYEDDCDEYSYYPLKEGESLTVTVTPTAGLDANLFYWQTQGKGVGYVMVEWRVAAMEQGVGGIETHTFIPSSLEKLTFGICSSVNTAGDYSFTVTKN